jgi:serine/threonine-protein kinase
MTDEKAITFADESGSKYQLLLELGRGGMGVAHLAIARGPQGFTKLVVLKMMRRQLVGDAESHRMFLQEARISARLAHPNVVHVYEVIEYDRAPTLVMEYLEGQTLWSLLRTPPPGAKLPVPLHLHILTKVLCGLHAAHELTDYDGTPLGLIHRDVSPHNVSVLFDGQVKVLDFGIAKASTSDVETRVGELKGKVRYMPPEQLVPENQDRRVDIFAVGVMLWEALTGRRYWGELAEGEVIASLLGRKLPPLPALAADVPAQLRFICAQALAPDPDDRYATAGEFQRDLEDYLLGEPDRASAEDDLGGFMRRHFEGEREAAKRAIEAAVQAVERIAEPLPDATRLVPFRSGTASRRVDSPFTSDIASASGPPADGDAPTRVLTTQTGMTSPPELSRLGRGLGARARRPRLLVMAALVGAATGLAMIALYAVVRPARAQMERDTEAGEPGAGIPASVCRPGLKPCGSECVSIFLPDHGCGADACGACNVANATSRCNQANRCDIAVCYQDYDDCDGDPRNGCETNVRTDPDNCGGCGRKCPALAHAQRGCGDACTIWRCDAGYRDCDGDPRNGCETPVASDPANCGHCGRACPSGTRCREGECR